MSVNHKLRQLAAVLPPYPKFKNGKPLTTWIVVAGAELMAQAIKEEKEPPADVASNKNYRVNKIVPVDHFEELKKIWRVKGITGVNDYCRKVQDFFNKTGGTF